MISPLHREQPPLTPAADTIYFHDWRWICHGGYSWLDPQGRYPGMWSQGPLPEMHYHYGDMPLGIRLVPQMARKTEPMLALRQPGDIHIFAPTVIREDGRYRLWYDVWPVEHIGEDKCGTFNYVRYAESDNGFDWKTPSLGLIERNGSTANNIVYGLPLIGESGYHGGCVFKDPSAPPAERYKVFHLGVVTPAQRERYLRARPNDPISCIEGGLFGAVSPDGLRWTRIEDPLVLIGSDTHNVCEFDPLLGQYVAYTRSWFLGRRSIARTSTTDYRRFPLHEDIFWPNASMAPYELFYACGKTKMFDAPDHHVMFPMRWTLTEDKFDLLLASSPDNVLWNIIPGGPVCVPGTAGDWDGGVVSPGIGMVELPGGRMGIPMLGSPFPHKHPRPAPLGSFAWATWPKGRLVALKADVEGSFALWSLRVKGRTARVNFKTPPAGFIQAEVVGPNSGTVPGRSFADCDHLSGDHLDRPITWRGQADLGHPENEAVALRFRLRSAELFSVTFA